ncbi:hypothetical protein BDZ91DRAFT_766731 [Kalaharituber pfeilii]|nr:hypothetical protein BDZ91DRAFT_766731 [Kalaharituber pfeilii]
MQTHHPRPRRSSNPGRVRLLDTYPAVAPNYSIRMSADCAKPIGDAVIATLRNHAASDKLHECSIVLAAATREIANQEEAHCLAMSDLAYDLWLRELAATLFASFLGVKQVEVLIRGLGPGGPHAHFVEWLKGNVKQEQKLFISPAQPGTPAPTEPSVTPPSVAAAGAAAKLKIRDLTTLLESLQPLTARTNRIVHSLSLAQVKRTMTHFNPRRPDQPSSPAITLEAFATLEKLVEAVLEKPYRRIDLADPTNHAPKGWKREVKAFRNRVQMGETDVGAKVEQEWRKLFQEWQWEQFVDFAVSKGMVATQADCMAAKQQAEASRKKAEASSKEAEAARKQAESVAKNAADERATVLERIDKLEQKLLNQQLLLNQLNSQSNSHSHTQQLLVPPAVPVFTPPTPDPSLEAQVNTN